jgi:diguanylate cyclase (GGDEF)-like protein/PAS domain S-box-containing protein
VKRSRGRGQALVLVSAVIVAVLATLAVYDAVRSHPSPAVPPSLSSYGVGAMALCCLGALFVALVSVGFVRREEGRRRRTERRMLRLQHGADQTEDLVTIVNRRGRIEYVNRAVEVTTGYDREELLGKRDGPWFPWYPEDATFDDVRASILAGNEFRGTLSCRRKDGTPFLLEEHIAPLREGKAHAVRFVSTGRDVTRRKETEDRLYQLLRFDSLTGAAHRKHFEDLLQNELGQRPAGDARLAVLVMDLDRFKYINDVFASEVGDHMLRHVVDVLRLLVGARGFVGRLGSDEFGVAYRTTAPAAEGGALAARILTTLAQNTTVGGQDVHATVSVGIASYPEDGDDAATLLKSATIALSCAKGFGRNSVRFFRREMSDQVVELYSIQRRVAGAFRKGEYHVHYQPYCDLRTGKVSGAEALIRWDNGDLGSVSPAKFIPVLEDSGLIVDVGEWVLRTACQQIRNWTRTNRPLPVAVNLSHIQFGHRDLVGLVSDTVQEHQINPRHLTLELTESICIHDIGFAADLLGKLKGVGVSISVDDFGTGYSSLSYVKKLPVDNLKIDMSFVRDVTRDPDAASIITAITSMARGLGLRTIAEGVETEEQRNILHLLRCDLGQGYHFGRAVGADTFETMFRDTPAPPVDEAGGERVISGSD